ADEHWITAKGTSAATDRYIVEADVDLRTITAIRLETGTDDQLAGKGPGRSVNGNIVLTDVRIAARIGDGDAVQQPLAAAAADFSQRDYPVANAIDRDVRS